MDSLIMTQHLISVESFESSSYFYWRMLLCLQHLNGFDLPWLNSAVMVQLCYSCNDSGILESASSAPPAWRWRRSHRAHQGHSYVLIKCKRDMICDTKKKQVYIYTVGWRKNAKCSKFVPSSVTASFQSASLTEVCQQTLAGLPQYLRKLSCPEDAV